MCLETARAQGIERKQAKEQARETRDAFCEAKREAENQEASEVCRREKQRREEGREQRELPLLTRRLPHSPHHHQSLIHSCAPILTLRRRWDAGRQVVSCLTLSSRCRGGALHLWVRKTGAGIDATSVNETCECECVCTHAHTHAHFYHSLHHSLAVAAAAGGRSPLASDSLPHVHRYTSRPAPQWQ